MPGRFRRRRRRANAAPPPAGERAGGCGAAARPYRPAAPSATAPPILPRHRRGRPEAGRPPPRWRGRQEPVPRPLVGFGARIATEIFIIWARFKLVGFGFFFFPFLFFEVFLARVVTNLTAQQMGPGKTHSHLQTLVSPVGRYRGLANRRHCWCGHFDTCLGARGPPSCIPAGINNWRPHRGVLLLPPHPHMAGKVLQVIAALGNYENRRSREGKVVRSLLNRSGRPPFDYYHGYNQRYYY